MLTERQTYGRTKARHLKQAVASSFVLAALSRPPNRTSSVERTLQARRSQWIVWFTLWYCVDLSVRYLAAAATAKGGFHEQKMVKERRLVFVA
jgi:hypothetical protein